MTRTTEISTDWLSVAPEREGVCLGFDIEFRAVCEVDPNDPDDFEVVGATFRFAGQEVTIRSPDPLFTEITNSLTREDEETITEHLAEALGLESVSHGGRPGDDEPHWHSWRAA